MPKILAMGYALRGTLSHMYVDKNMQLHCDIADDVVMVKMVSFYICCHLLSISGSDASICKTRVLKMPENGFNFRLLATF